MYIVIGILISLGAFLPVVTETLLNPIVHHGSIFQLGRLSLNDSLCPIGRFNIQISPVRETRATTHGCRNGLCKLRGLGSRLPLIRQLRERSIESKLVSNLVRLGQS